MNVSLDGLLINSANDVRGQWGYSLMELLENLRELKQRNDKAALDEFFAVYVIDDEPAEKQSWRRD
jgi:hypothetical protein